MSELRDWSAGFVCAFSFKGSNANSSEPAEPTQRGFAVFFFSSHLPPRLLLEPKFSPLQQLLESKMGQVQWLQFDSGTPAM